MGHGEDDTPPISSEEFDRLYPKPGETGLATIYSLVLKVSEDLDAFRQQSREERDRISIEVGKTRETLLTHVRDEKPAVVRRRVNACVILCLGLVVVNAAPALMALEHFGIPKAPTIGAFFAWAAWEFFGVKLPWHKGE